jgi:hypothetical protein
MARVLQKLSSIFNGCQTLSAAPCDTRATYAGIKSACFSGGNRTDNPGCRRFNIAGKIMWPLGTREFSSARLRWPLCQDRGAGCQKAGALRGTIFAKVRLLLASLVSPAERHRECHSWLKPIQVSTQLVRACAEATGK